MSAAASSLLVSIAMRIIDRYIARQIFVATLMITTGVTFAVWLTQSLRFLDYIVNRGLPLSSFISLVGLMLPAFLSVVLPIALFIGTLFVMHKLLAESEIVVLRAAGLPNLAIARAAILVGLCFVGVGYFVSLYLMPTSYRAFKDWQFRIRHEYSQVILQEGVFNQLIRGVTVYVRERNSRGELFGIFIHDSRAHDRRITIQADSGVLAQTESGPQILLVNGSRQEVERETGKLQLLEFESYKTEFKLEEESSDERWRESNERYLGELFNPTDEQRPKVLLSLAAEGHQRLAGPLFALAYPLIAAAFLLRGEHSRRGQIGRVLGAIVAVVLVQSAALGVQNAASKASILFPLIYLNALVPIVAAVFVLTRRRLRKPPADAPVPSATADAGAAVAAE